MDDLQNIIMNLTTESVEYKSLREIANIKRGGSFQKKDMFDSGMPCIHYGQIYTQYDLYAKNSISFVSDETYQKQKKASPGDIIMAVTSENMEDVCKCVVWMGNTDIAVSGHTAIISHQQNAKYLAYCFQTSDFQAQKRKIAHGTKVIEVTPDSLYDISIPVPSLEIQQKVVEVLDALRDASSELKDLLSKEINYRRQHFSYFRDELLRFDDDVPLKTLPDISVNHDRKRKPVTKKNRQAGCYPYYGASGIVDYVAEYLFDGDYLLVSEDGANLLARSTPIAFSIVGKNWVNNHAHVLKFESYEMRKYVEIYLNSIDLNKYISGGAQPKLNQDNLNKIQIPVPEFSIVKRVVDTLVELERLNTEICGELYREVEQRQKQFEYYRDRLLTFKDAV